MIDLRLYEFCFSPTGGTERVLNIVTSVWNCEKIRIDLCDEDCNLSELVLEKDDIAFIAVPSFGGRVPKVVIERMKKISGNGARMVLICVYGNRAIDDTLTELEDNLSSFEIIAAISAVAEHSIMRNYASGRPDNEDNSELIEFADEIKRKIENNIKNKPELPGMHITYKEYNGVPFKPEAGKKCNHCGFCADKCPVKAINNDGTTDKIKCISCMRCISLCPSNARSVNKVMLFAASKKMAKVCSGRKKNKLFI